MWASGKKVVGGSGGFDSYFSAYRNAVQGLTNSAWTKILFNVENYDNNNEYDHVTNHRWTCKVAGKYHLDAGVGTAILATDKTAIMKAELNADTPLFTHNDRLGFNGVVFMSVSGDYVFAVDDYVEIFVLHTNGSNINTDHSNSDPWFNMHRIA